METLEKLFGGAARVKLMRLFLFNPTSNFTASEISERSKIDSDKTRKELNFLRNAGLAKRSSRSGGRPVWHLNERFPYLSEIQKLLLQSSLVSPQSIIKKLSKVGRLKALILAGLFKEQWEDRLDMLVIADGLKKGKVDALMKTLEAEIGKEIRYAVLETADFKYRLSIGDKLIRDVLDYPHDVVLDKAGIVAVV